MKYDEISKRINIALSENGLSAQELSNRSGVNKASISQYVNGSHAPSNITSGKMAKVLNVDPLWLMGFDVPMRKEDLYDELLKLKTQESVLDSISKDIKVFRIAVALTQLSDPDKDMVENFVGRLLQSSQSMQQQPEKQN